MPDLWLEWNDDFQISASGGLLLADGDDFARQRIERRLFTARQGYIWDQAYGAGLPQKIGRPASVAALTALVRSQIALESSVAPFPAPVIQVEADANQLGLFTISIHYTSAATGEPVTLTLAP
jgi:hypothetical protein